MAVDTRLRFHAAAAALACLATACTTATPYQAYRSTSAGGVHGGYSDQRLASDRFIVTFHGNDLTSRERVEGYLLYRAAELTLQNGFDWFTIIDRRTEHDVRTYVRPDPYYRPWFGGSYAQWQPYWRYYRRGYGWNVWYPGIGDPFWADRTDIQRVELFEASAEIILHKGPIPATEERAFDAHSVMTDLKPTIELPKERL